MRVYLEAENLLSRRYFSGEDIYFPASREELSSLLASVKESQDHYLQFVAPELSRGQDEKTDGKEGKDGQDTEELAEQRLTAKRARDYAGQLVVLAKAEALTDLGEKNQGVRLVERWLREEAGWDF